MPEKQVNPKADSHPPATGWLGWWFDSKWGWLAPVLLLALGAAFFRFYLFSENIANNDVPGYIFAAETFALGKLKVPVPAPDHPDIRQTNDEPQFFRTWMVVPNSFDDLDKNGEKYRFMYSRYSPGYPAVLFLGKMILRDYKLIPLIIVALIAFGLHRILALTHGRRAARWGLTLLAISPFFVAFATSLLSHGATMMCLTYAVLFHVLADKAKTAPGRALFAGAAAFMYGFVILCRPMTGACVSLAALLWELYRLKREGFAIILPRWLPMALGAALPLAALLLYNQHLTGSALDFPFTQFWPRDKPGFTSLFTQDTEDWEPNQFREHESEFKGEDVIGSNESRYFQFTPFDAIRNLLDVLGRFNQTLLIFPGGLLLLAVLYFYFRAYAGDYRGLHLACASLILAGHFFYFASGTGHHAWGPRYEFACLLPVFLLLAPLLAEATKKLDQAVSGKFRFPLVLLLAIACAANCVTSYQGEYANQIEVSKFRQKLHENLAETVTAPALVFLPYPVGKFSQYIGHQHATLINSPDLHDPVIYAINNGEANRKLVNREEFKHRHLYEITQKGEVVPLDRKDY